MAVRYPTSLIMTGKSLFVFILCSVFSTVLSQDVRSDREIRIVDGDSTSPGQYPFLTALLSGRDASITINGETARAQFFGHGIQSAFDGTLAECGFATTVCQQVDGKICAITFAPALSTTGLSPAEQLEHCSLGGGIGAIFRTSDNVIGRTDLFDGIPGIPAVFVFERATQETLLFALRTPLATLSVQPILPDTAFCGATYLGNQWALTAAHCVVETTNDGVRIRLPWEVLVNVGAFDLRLEQALLQQVSEVVVLNYQRSGITNENDIALLKISGQPSDATSGVTDGLTLTESSTESLREATGATGLRIATASNIQEKSDTSSRALVLGWGSTQVREPLVMPSVYIDTTSAEPRSAWLTLNPVENCLQQWGDFLEANSFSRDAVKFGDSHLCAFDPVGQRDTCQGDSGGPLLLEVDGVLELAGITSFGLGCGSRNSVPGVYTRVSAHTEWIESVTGLNLQSDSSLSDPSPDQPLVTLSASNANTSASGDSASDSASDSSRSAATGGSGGGSAGLSALLLTLLFCCRPVKTDLKPALASWRYRQFPPG